jgi:hypothetical protein
MILLNNVIVCDEKHSIKTLIETLNMILIENFILNLNFWLDFIFWFEVLFIKLTGKM